MVLGVLLGVALDTKLHLDLRGWRHLANFHDLALRASPGSTTLELGHGYREGAGIEERKWSGITEHFPTSSRQRCLLACCVNAGQRVRPSLVKDDQP